MVFNEQKNLEDKSEIDKEVASLLRSEIDVLPRASEIWAKARSLGPVYKAGTRHLILGFDEVKSIVSDPRLGNNGFYVGKDAEAIRSRLSEDEIVKYWEMFEFESLQLGRADGAVHDRLRSIAKRAFTLKRIQMLKGSVEELTTELLTSLEGRENVNLVTEFTHVIPLRVIVDLLGVPRENAEKVSEWSSRLARWRGAGEAEVLLDAHTAMREFTLYIEEHIERARGGEPDTELVASLMQAGEGGQLSTEELVAFYVMLLLAGHETTTNLLGIGLLELQKRPDQWQMLCEDPGLVPNAVFELLRYVSPVQFVGRVALEHLEVGGVDIDAGESVLPIIASANHDESAFEDPEELDITRSDARSHVAFGYGPHFCLGQQLAQLEAGIIIREISQRYPDLTLDVDAAAFGGSIGLRALKNLPASFGRDRGSELSESLA